MPVAFDLEFVVSGDLRTGVEGELSVDLRTDLSARIKNVVIGELTEGHKPHGFADPALTLPGHIALHRMFIQRFEKVDKQTCKVSVRLHTLSDRVDRCQRVVTRLNDLRMQSIFLPRTHCSLALCSWKVVAGETWNSILDRSGSTPAAARTETDVVLLDLQSPALRRSRQMGWKTPDVSSLLDAAGWNLVRLLAVGDQWVTVGSPKPPADRIEALVSIDQNLSRIAQVDASVFASAAVKEATFGVNGITGQIALRLPVDDSKRVTALCWIRAFGWTGLGGYGTAGCGHVSVR